MAQVRQPLERAGKLARAATHHGFGARCGGLPHQLGVQRAGTAGRELERLRPSRFAFDHADNLGDHIACSLQDHRVANAHVQASNLVGIVQGRVDHNDTTHGHGPQSRHRRDGAGTAHLYIDGLQDRARLFRRKFPRDSPARRAAYEPQPLLPIQAIDFVDNAVDIKGKLRPLRFKASVGRGQAIRAFDADTLRRHLETPGPERLQGLPLGLRKR